MKKLPWNYSSIRGNVTISLRDSGTTKWELLECISLLEACKIHLEKILGVNK